MRTDNPATVHSGVDRLRALYGRARRRTADRAPAWLRSTSPGQRLLGMLAVAAIAALGVGYILKGHNTPSAAYVLSGRTLSPDDLIRVERALQAKGLSFRVDHPQSRVEVASNRLAEADEILAKLEVGPRPLNELDRLSREAGSLIETPWDREQRVEQAQLEQLAEIIRRLDPDGIAGVRVRVNRPKARVGQRNTSGAKAFVYLEMLDDREVSALTVRSIIGMVASFIPEVREDAVSLWDRQGRHYADADNPQVKAKTQALARAEEIRREIRDKLDWVKGVQVSVNLVEAPIDPTAAATETSLPMPSPMPMPAATPLPPQHLPPLPPLPSDPPPPPPAEEVRVASPGGASRAPAVGVNQPLDLDDEDEPAPSPVEEPEPKPAVTEPLARPVSPPVEARPSFAPSMTTNQAELSASRTPTPARPVVPSRAQVWVKVPRSYYLKALPNREPTLDDIQPIKNRTEELIRTAVEHVVPPTERGDVRISTIPDALPAPPPSPVLDDRRIPQEWWIPALAGASATAVLLGLMYSLVHVRRPALRAASRSERGRFKIDEAEDVSGPGPSERVRELIRLNPEAAASVLHRWTGQGGPTS